MFIFEKRKGIKIKSTIGGEDLVMSSNECPGMEEEKAMRR